MPDSPWKELALAPGKAPDTEPAPVILFLPSASHDTDAEGRPKNVKHARVVGWWDEASGHWKAGFHPDRVAENVYPSLWAELPAEPEGV